MPDGLRFALAIIFTLILIGALIGWRISQEMDKNPVEGLLEREYSLIYSDKHFIQAVTPTYYPNIQTLGALAERIIFCESSGRPDVCNQQYGCGAGMGLFQLIPSTVKYCEGKLGKSIDPFDPDDNYECGMWLLENEGPHHWGTETSWWGSYDCWKEYH